METYTKIFSLCAVIGVVGCFSLYNHQKKVTDGYASQIRTEKTEANQFKTDGSNISIKGLKRQYDESTPNVNKTMSESRRNLQKGLYLAFNDCHTESAFKRHKAKILSLLGNEVGDKVLSVVNPAVNQGDNPLMQKYQAPHSSSDHVSDLHIAYGAYDDSSNSLPAEVVVTFQTPAYNENYQASVPGEVNRAVPHAGHVILKGTVAVDSGHFSVMNSHAGIQQDN